MTIHPAAATDQPCSFNSRSVGEPIIGTAPKTESWILLEVPGPPGANALQDSPLPLSIKEYLKAAQSALASPRLLLIRKGDSALRNGYAFYLASANVENPRLYEFRLEGYEDLTRLDFSAILNGDPAYAKYIQREPIFVICTNGKRDPCCARWGVAAYQALANQKELAVWQTSHVGGHRFAANMVCLPYGIYYGHVAPEQTAKIVSDARQGNITLENYRGRAVYPPAAQIAEYYLRIETHDASLDGFCLSSVMETSPDQWEVSFASAKDGKSHKICLEGELTGASIFESCSTPNDLKPVKQYRYSLG